MHVDGGTVAQVFVYPPSLRLRKAGKAAGAERVRSMYIIRNARLDPNWAQVERRVMPIATRAMASLIQTQGRGDLFRIHSVALRGWSRFRTSRTSRQPSTPPHPEDFDTGYMTALFKLGYDMAAAGYPWAKAPPGY